MHTVTVSSNPSTPTVRANEMKCIQHCNPQNLHNILATRRRACSKPTLHCICCRLVAKHISSRGAAAPGRPHKEGTSSQKKKGRIGVD